MSSEPQQDKEHANTANRAFCFTINNPTEDDVLVISSLPSNPWPKLLQFVCQLEQGEQGTPHYQGYARFESPQRFKHFKRLIGKRAHVVPAGGSSWKNYLYCTKLDGRLGEPIIIGEFTEPRSKSRGYSSRAEVLKYVQENPLITVPELISKGALEVLVSKPGLLGIARGYLNRNARRDGVLVYYFYGSPGCGKSRLADELYPNAYRKPSGRWWDGYDGEPEVIIDDLDVGDFPFGEMLRVLDRYPFRAEVKGGYVALAATVFVITSNWLPTEIYATVKSARMRALFRRITEFWNFDTMSIYTGDSMDSATPTFVRSFELPWHQHVTMDAPVTPLQEYFDADVE